MADGTRNPKIARRKLAKLDRQRQVSRLLSSGFTQVAVAEMLGVSQGTVSRDWQVVRGWWQEDAVEAVEAMRARQLAAINHIEADAVMQFAKTSHPRWLALRLRCQERRAKLFGLDAPVRVAQTDSAGRDVEPPITEIVVEIERGAPVPVDDEGRPLMHEIGAPDACDG